MLAYRDKQSYDCPYWQYKIDTAPDIVQWFDDAVAYFQSLIISDTEYYQMLEKNHERKQTL